MPAPTDTAAWSASPGGGVSHSPVCEYCGTRYPVVSMARDCALRDLEEMTEP